MNDIYVARQPIFNRQQQTVAYELLYRSGNRNDFGDNDREVASLATIERTLHAFGLDALIGSKTGFYNASRELLLQEFWNLLPVRGSVIELLETIEPDEAILQACQALKKAGYQLALDDFVYGSEYEELLKLVDIIKIDFLLTEGSQRAELVKRYAPHGITMLAEKVETWKDFHQATAAGYHLFQGYFFCKPEMVSTREVPSFKGNLLQLVAELNRLELDFDALETLIRREMALSVKLLRYLRSASLGWRHEVDTIGQAIRVLGEKAIRRWASLVAYTMIGNDKPSELVTTSLVRAQFCEQIGHLLPTSGPTTDFFLLGMLSTLEALLDQPMEVLLAQMPLSSDITAALHGDDTTAGRCLKLAIAWDQADWPSVDLHSTSLAIPVTALPTHYAEAVRWVSNLHGDS